jgi:hypothetical protein
LISPITVRREIGQRFGFNYFPAGFDTNLCTIIIALQMNKCIRKLILNKTFNNAKSKGTSQVMEAIVDLIYMDDSVRSLAITQISR